MVRSTALWLATVLLGACQTAGTATSTPTEVAAVPTATPGVAATPAPTKPVTLPRGLDIPLDGSCEDPNVSCFGKLEAGKVYETKVFKPTISFSVPTSDWVNALENGGNFPLLSTRDAGDGIAFLREARSVDENVGRTVSEIAAWLEDYDQLTVTPALPVNIGGLSGVSLDLRLAPAATNLDPGCPVQVCAEFLRGDDPDPNNPYQWHWGWGIAGTEAQRLYLLEGDDTVVAIGVSSLDGLTFDTLTQTFDQIAETLVIG